MRKTVGVATSYLVDDLNPTGFAQVLLETFTGSISLTPELSHTFVYGLERLSQRRSFQVSGSGQTQNNYYVYDGHGSVRALTDQTGAVTDTYDYDAFGNLIHSTGTTPNNYLFAGEQFDPDLNLYYNRARYLNTSTGRFWSMDTYEGNDQDPLSLGKYVYVEADPVDSVDPTGRILSNFLYGGIVHRELGIDFTRGGANRFSDATINTILGAIVPGGSLRPDLADRSTGEVYEIKPPASTALGYVQLAGYLIAMNKFDPLRRIWVPGATYLPQPVIQLGGGVIAIGSPPAGGVIVYDVLNPVEILGLVALALRVSFAGLKTEIGLATVTTAEGGF